MHEERESTPLRAIMNICSTCLRNKTVEGAQFMHVRLGPPETLLCKCRDQSAIICLIMGRFASTTKVVRLSTNAIIDTIPNMKMNSVMMTNVSAVPYTEIELRLDKDMSMQMGRLIEMGMLGNVTKCIVRETGCYWRSGPKLKPNGKVRCSTNEGKIVKFPISVYTVVPGIKLMVSHEDSFKGYVLVPDYRTEMTELKSTCTLGNVVVTMISRAYASEGPTSYRAPHHGHRQTCQ